MLKVTIKLIIIKKLKKTNWLKFFKKLKKKKLVRFKLRRWKRNFKRIKPFFRFYVYRLHFNFKPKYIQTPITNQIKCNIKQKTIKLFFVQQSFKSAQLLVFDSKHKIIQSFLTDKILDDYDAFSYISLISNQFENKFNISLYIKLRHSNFFKKLNVVIDHINEISFIKTNKLTIFILKPNFFFINLQYKKIRSIKKSRKKLMYKVFKQKTRMSINVKHIYIYYNIV